MTKVIDWAMAVFLVGMVAFLGFIAYDVATYESKPVPVTVTCVGDYKVFTRGDQFDVLFSEECERRNVRPPLLRA